jgi:hypothetical protein
MAFCRKWYGEGQEGRWNVDCDGTARPMARMDSRGEELMEALVEGNYDEICNEGDEEGMPDAVRVLYARGLFLQENCGQRFR